MEFKTIKECVNQLLMCDYECEAGFLKNNTAFIRLKEIAELPYQPAFFLNEMVYHDNKPYYIRCVRTAACSHPDYRVEYDLSNKYNRPCTTNESDIIGVIPISVKHYEDVKITEAKEYLKSKGITTI